MAKAHGVFDVEMHPDGEDDSAEGTTLGRMIVEKRFHGDLEGTGRGRMSTGKTSLQGSAGYVLIERVQGRLHGRTGTFLLQHWGILDRGVQDSRVEVIPDSGSGELAGLKGRLTGRIENGVHSYELDYSLARRR
ncbi:MAG TPA: DUF3224 domain-containing protein [Thermoplasmata archaeon]|jgi:hypothetical protein